jgi:hypothetical protein
VARIKAVLRFVALQRRVLVELPKESLHFCSGQSGMQPSELHVRRSSRGRSISGLYNHPLLLCNKVLTMETNADPILIPVTATITIATQTSLFTNVLSHFDCTAAPKSTIVTRGHCADADQSKEHSHIGMLDG